MFFHTLLVVKDQGVSHTGQGSQTSVGEAQNKIPILETSRDDFMLDVDKLFRRQ